MARLLIVDDEAKIRALVKKYAVFEGHEAEEAEDGLRAVELLQTKPFDLLIIDVMMPGMDGFSVLRQIRKTSRVPAIMLSARGEEYDRIHGFQAGVDDYVVKPFSPKELMLRVAAVLGRTAVKEDAAAARQVYACGGLVADQAARRLVVDGKEVPLAPKEYDLLFYLVQNKNIALTRDMLLCRVWGYDFEGDERTLDTHIKRLRRALGPYSGRIITLRGTGYRFDG